MFKTNTSLAWQKMIHTWEIPYECEISKKTFISSYKLTVHKKVHTGEKPYDCEILYYGVQ